jgi:hypothetical protein
MTAAYIDIPYQPLPIQAQIHKSLKRFNVVVLHRGCGKSYLAINELIKQAFTCEDNSGALFVYIAPEKQQAKDIIWAKLKYFTKNIPDIKIREDELSITFPDNNATIRLEGADKPDRLRGIHPHFVVLDEVGQMKRDTWYEAVFPSLQRNNGSVLFIGTPKGNNLFKELYDLGMHLTETGEDDRWYCTIKNIYETGVFKGDAIDNIKKIMPESKWEQEYLCKWDAVFTGAYYSDMLSDEDKGILSDVPYNPMYPVITGWDLGTQDKTCIWFAQKIDNKFCFMDYYENNGQDIYHYINIIKNKQYRYAYHILPHDATQRGWETKSTRLAIFQRLGLKAVQAKKLSIEEGISIVQANLYISRFDRRRCAKGIQHLMSYRSKVDRISGEETGEPLHDAASDAADALRTFFVGVKRYGSDQSGMYSWDTGPYKKQQTIHEYDYFEGI